MRKAEQFLKKKKRSHKFLGGFVSPCHPMYLRMKLGEHCVPHSTRNYMVHLALVDEKRWSLDAYMSSTNDYESNEEVVLAFQRRLIKFAKGVTKFNTDVFWVVGTDNYHHLSDELRAKNVHLLVVENRNADSLARMKKLREASVVLKEEEAAHYHFVHAEPLNVSSKAIRQQLQDPAVASKYELLQELIGVPYACQFILDRGLFGGASNATLYRKIHDAPKIGLDREKMGLRNLQKNKQLMSNLLVKAELINARSCVKSYELERVGEEHGFSGLLARLKNVKIEDRSAEEPVLYDLEETFVLKIVDGLTHTTNHYSEGTFLLSVGNQFMSPVFPQCHLIALDKSHKANQDKASQFYLLFMEDLHWAESLGLEQGLKGQELLRVVDRLAEFHCHYLESKHLQKFENDILYGANDELIKGFFRRGLQEFLKHKEHFSVEVKAVSRFLELHFDQFFELLYREPLTVCHGDFNPANIMLGRRDDLDRVCFVDWQTAFIGSGAVDLATLLLYGADVAEFEGDKDFELKAVRFYFERLTRHGFNNSLAFESAPKTTTKDWLRSFKQAKFFVFLRYVCGYQHMLLHLDEGTSLKAKWDNCVRSVYYTYHNERIAVFNHF